jgi:hypothetical protein
VTFAKLSEFCFYWKMAIFKGANGYFLAGAAAFLGFTDSDDFRSQRMIYVRLMFFVLIASHKHLESFMDQTMSRLRAGKDPLGTGDTELFLKKTTTEIVKPGAG